MNLLRLALGGEKRYNLDWYAEQAALYYQGLAYGGVNQTYNETAGRKTEKSESPFEQWVQGAYKSNGVVFACQVARLLLFSEARFQFQRLREGDLFGTEALQVLERPWPNGSTGELLARMIQDVDLAGNAYIRRTGPMAEPRLERLRPDWVSIVLGSHPDLHTLDILGYLYEPNGPGRGEPVVLNRDEVAHWSPIPDPIASYRGMSWLTPVLREIRGDGGANDYKQKFFDNAAPQPLDARVLTPQGWSTMGEMALGQQVIGLDGKPHDVIGVYPQGERDIYRVTFSDGAVTECTEDHLWSVANLYDRKTGTRRTRTLAQLVDAGITYRKGEAKWSVPLVEPVQFTEDVPLPVDPYLMGALLGDGSFRGNSVGSGGVSLAAHDDDADEMEKMLAGRLPAGVSITRRDRDLGHWSEFYFKGPGSPRPNPLTQLIRGLGLWECPGPKKFIPSPYLRASVEDRVALLQGLIDSDGSVGKQPALVRFTNTSLVLCEQLAELTRGLGGTASVTYVAARNQWTVLVKRLPEWIIPCRLSRKVQRYQPAQFRRRYRYMSRVELVGRKPAQCIRVDVGDSLYVTDDYIVTHNTPNMVVKFDPTVSVEAMTRFKEVFNAEHAGFSNAFKTLFLGGGADATVVGNSFEQMDLKNVQGALETRIAAAAGTPPVIVGLSEGLAAATYSNYAQARRRFADLTVRPLWRTCAAALETIVPTPTGSRLWYDDHHVPALQEDEKDAADIESVKANTIAALVREGFEPDSAVKAVTAEDMTLLKHSGRVSVQLLEPGEPKNTNGQVPEEVNA